MRNAPSSCRLPAKLGSPQQVKEAASKIARKDTGSERPLYLSLSNKYCQTQTGLPVTLLEEA
jgi:hypothetical protein